MKFHPLATKLATLFAIVVLLVIALDRIGDLVGERRGRAEEARRSIEQAQSGPQALLGPVVRTVCREDWTETERRGDAVATVRQRRDLTVDSTPDSLDIVGRAAMEARYRGIFKANTYVASATLRATWSLPPAPTPEHAGGQVTCDAPVLAVAVTDSRGLRDVRVQVGGQALPVRPGTPFDKHPRGFHAVLPAAGSAGAAQPLSAEVVLQLVGTGDLALAPVGDRNTVALSADWAHPSFGGRFLPVARTVQATGFDASWTVTSLATTAGRDFLAGAPLCAGVGATDNPAAATASGAPADGCVETFGVAFIDPVNAYSLTDRALKYGLLFIALSFVAVGMVEVLRQRRVHPVQYLLVGSALALFFLLLLSLSEHLAFGLSYAIASAACATLLAYYVRHVLGSWAAGGGFGTGIALLYGALYLLLQLEQTAMLLGALLLFAVLAAVMVATRRVDWYGLTRSTPTAP